MKDEKEKWKNEAEWKKTSERVEMERKLETEEWRGDEKKKKKLQLTKKRASTSPTSP